MTDVLEPSLDDQPGPVDATPAVAQPVPDAPAARRRRTGRELVELVSTVVIVAGASLYTLLQLHPDLILTDAVPAGGDFGAHVWGPAYLRDHLLPHLRLSGWAPDWYAGLPMYHFYMVVPALAVVALDVLLPYGMALKVIHVLGIVTLPVAAWAFGKLAGFRYPVPPLLAIASVFFLFDETFTIYGGNIASTMAGEFSFSIALSLAVLFLGLFAYGLRTGRRRATAAVVFALCALCHLIVAFFAIAGAVIWFLFWIDKRRFLYAASVGVVGALLTAFWMLPFWFRGPFMTDMYYERRLDFWVMLFPQSRPLDVLITGVALVGFVGAILRRHRSGMALGALCLFYAVWARFWPQSHLWNARLLPFLYLTRYFLVALGLVEIGRAVARFIAPGSERADWIGRTTTAGVTTVAAVFVMGLHVQNLPGLQQYYDEAAGRWEYGLAGPELGVASKPAFVDDWAKWNYSGYEAKQAYGEYHGIVTEMERLGEERGCGRALWENNNSQDKYGTPMALMLLPFWTDGCIGSMEGLFFEASGTTPYHFLATSALSERSSNPVRRLRYEDGQVDKGVEYLKKLGVRYYLAYNPSVTDQADLDPDLEQVGASGPWRVYEVQRGNDLVVPLTTEPVVVEGMSSSPLGAQKSRDRWLEVGTSWFQDSEAWPALPAADGPSEWTRVTTEITPEADGQQRPTTDRHLARVQPSAPITAESLPAVAVTDVRTSDDSISFSVDQVGVPVLVRASYFPNWQVEGADGPYRVAPNFMVVVPTDTDVRLKYGYTPIDVLSYLLTFLGIAGVVWLWRAGPVRYDDEPAVAGHDDLFLLDWDEPFDAQPLPPPAPPASSLDIPDDEDDVEVAAGIDGDPGDGTPR